MESSEHALAAGVAVEVRIDDVGDVPAALTDHVRERGAGGPPIRMVFLAHRGNFAQLYRLVRLSAELRVDEVRVEHLPDADPARSVLSDPAAEQSFELAREEAARRGVALTLPALCAPQHTRFRRR